MTPNDQFLSFLAESEPRLEQMGFTRANVRLKGSATYVEYSGINSSVLLMYGPSEWHVEMVITIGSQRYKFKDLLQFPEIVEWWDEYKSLRPNTNPLQSEVIWCTDLLAFALGLIKR